MRSVVFSILVEDIRCEVSAGLRKSLVVSALGWCLISIFSLQGWLTQSGLPGSELASGEKIPIYWILGLSEPSQPAELGYNQPPPLTNHHPHIHCHPLITPGNPSTSLAVQQIRSGRSSSIILLYVWLTGHYDRRLSLASVVLFPNKDLTLFTPHLD